MYTKNGYGFKAEKFFIVYSCCQILGSIIVPLASQPTMSRLENFRSKEELWKMA